MPVSVRNEPIRRGAVYCAPFCGGGCTWRAHQEAVERARALVERLGPGWKPRVWENLGWHSQVIDSTELLKVHPSVDGSTTTGGGTVTGYTAFLGEGSGGRWAEHRKTPEQAIEAVTKLAEAELAHVITFVDAGKAALSDLGWLRSRNRP